MPKAGDRLSRSAVAIRWSPVDRHGSATYRKLLVQLLWIVLDHGINYEISLRQPRPVQRRVLCGHSCPGFRKLLGQAFNWIDFQLVGKHLEVPSQKLQS